VVAEAGGLVLVVLVGRAIGWWRDRHGYRGVHRVRAGHPAYHRPMTTPPSDQPNLHPDEDYDPLADPDASEPAPDPAPVQVTPAQGQPVQVDPASPAGGQAPA
jgi:hypothetical protein